MGIKQIRTPISCRHWIGRFREQKLIRRICHCYNKHGQKVAIAENTGKHQHAHPTYRLLSGQGLISNQITPYSNMQSFKKRHEKETHVSRDKQISEKSMRDLILPGWRTVDVNANLCKSERNFTIDVRARHVEMQYLFIVGIFFLSTLIKLSVGTFWRSTMTKIHC